MRSSTRSRSTFAPAKSACTETSATAAPSSGLASRIVMQTEHGVGMARAMLEDGA